MAEPAAVSLVALDRLAGQMGLPSRLLLGDLVEAYRDQADAWVPEFAEAARGGDTSRFRRIAHTLSSSSIQLGAQALADLLDEATVMVRAESVGAADLIRVAAAVEAEYARVSTILDAEYGYRDRRTTTGG